jgi:hypothetical protein
MESKVESLGGHAGAWILLVSGGVWKFSPEDRWFLILGLVDVDVKLVVLGVCTVQPGS